MSKTIGENIKYFRKQHQMTQLNLAQAVGVSVQAVSKWECGGTPDVELLPVISDVFAITIDQLFGRRTSVNESVNHSVAAYMEYSTSQKKMQKAAEICWSTFKGLTNMPNIGNISFIDSFSNPNHNFTRCRVSSQFGIAYVNADANCPSFFIMPEPHDGYSSALLNSDEYVKVFSLLSNHECMDILIYLCKRKSAPDSPVFSMEQICKELNISSENMLNYLESFIEFGWLISEQVEIEKQNIVLYRSALTEAALAFLYYCAEMTIRFQSWYISDTIQRKKPIIT